jgi:hypothetical protein
MEHPLSPTITLKCSNKTTNSRSRLINWVKKNNLTSSNSSSSKWCSNSNSNKWCNSSIWIKNKKMWNKHRISLEW